MPMETSILAFTMALNVLSETPVSSTVLSLASVPSSIQAASLLSTHKMALSNRQRDAYVNGVFRDNILLNVSYMAGKIKDPSNIDWDYVRKPFHYEIILNPGEVFAFHDDVLASYKGKIARTTNAHFNPQEGFKSDGYLFGDGVCHLASLINWVAQDAKLSVYSPTRHDFAPIPDIPREYGTSIYYYPGQNDSNSRQNLYIKNDFKIPVKFSFDYFNDILTVSVFQMNNYIYAGLSGI